ncbi:MAG: hypothetical protein AAF517_28655, partial [Planctomycetota bacterium]
LSQQISFPGGGTDFRSMFRVANRPYDLCVERERRPLGCRTYFCDPEYRDETEAVYEELHREIQSLAERYGIPYRYEPFVAALREPQVPETSAVEEKKPRDETSR